MRIGELVKVNELSINQSYAHTFIEYIDTSSVQDGIILNRQILPLNEAPSRARRVVRKNDILLSTVRPSLKHYAIINDQKPNTVASTGFAVITSKKIYHKYLYYFLTTKWYTEYLSIIAESQQSNFPAFNPSLIEKTDIPLPSLPIQKKIAAILSAYDDLIENNNRRIAILEKMAEELYREWFVRLRFPGHENVKIIKGVPEGWSKVKLEDICCEKRRTAKKKDISDSTKYIGLEHIPPRSIIISEYGYASDIQSDKLLFDKRDILFAKIRPYLHKVSLAHFTGVCSSDTIVIKPQQIQYEAFIYFTVASDSFIDLATTSSTGTKMPRADWDFLEKQTILLPEESLLVRFQELFGQQFTVISNHQIANEYLRESRDRLLSRFMSGKIDVEDMDIQFPASMRCAEPVEAQEESVDA